MSNKKISTVESVHGYNQKYTFIKTKIKKYFHLKCKGAILEKCYEWIWNW